MQYTSYLQIIDAKSVKPVIVIIASTLLVVLHRYYGSVEFAANLFESGNTFLQPSYMFASAFLLLGLIPVLIITFGFNERLKDYGLTIGDKKAGMLSLVVLTPLIVLALIYPSSQTAEMKNFYPFDPSAHLSIQNFIQLEFWRVILFYTAWEFMFRGFMLFGLRKYVGDSMALCIQVIPSCLWHIGMPSGEIISSIPGGILFGILALRTRSIIYPLILHCIIGISMDLLIVVTN